MFISSSKVKEIECHIETLQKNLLRLDHINNTLLKYLNLSLFYRETIDEVSKDYEVKGIMGTGRYSIFKKKNKTKNYKKITTKSQPNHNQISKKKHISGRATEGFIRT